MPQTQMAEFTANPPASGGVVRRSVDRAALIAPALTGAAVSANVVGSPYRRATDVGDDFDGTSVESALVAGAKAAFRSGAKQVVVASYDVTEAANEVITDSDTTAISTGTLANGPITEVTAVSVDGTVMTTISYTEADPATLTPGATEAIINTTTKKIKVGTTTSGAGAGIVVTYKHADLDSLTPQLDKQPFRIITIAGETYNTQSLGLVNALLDYAVESDKEVAFALDAGVANTDMEDAVTAIRDKRLRLIAAHGSGDLSSAWAALIASRPAWATRKDQPAPAGFTYTDSYIRREFGDDRDPAAGTWHSMGVNAVYLDPAGVARVSSDRAAVGYTDAYRWMSTYAVERLVKLDAEDDVRSSRQSSDTGMPYNEGGLAALESTIRGSVNRQAQRGAITRLVDVQMPEKDDMSESDITARAVVGADVLFEHAGQIHTVFVTLNSSQ